MFVMGVSRIMIMIAMEISINFSDLILNQLFRLHFCMTHRFKILH